jgi:hypothetical protein
MGNQDRRHLDKLGMGLELGSQGSDVLGRLGMAQVVRNLGIRLLGNLDRRQLDNLGMVLDGILGML